MASTLATRIYVCGKLVAVLAGRRNESSLPGRQGRLLFAYLVLNRAKPSRRDELIEAIWGPKAPADANGALSALVSKLRRAIDPVKIEGRSSLEIRLPADAWVDLEAAEEALHRAESSVALEQWHEAWSPARVAVQILGRGFLAGLDGTWVEERRLQVQQLEILALDCYAHTCLGIGGTELAAAERSARRLVEKAPFREGGYRLLMRALAACGEVVEAVRVYEMLRQRLREQLGVGPGPETQAVHAELLKMADD